MTLPLLTQSGLQPSASYDVVNEIVEMIRSFIKKTKDEGKYDELATQVLQFKLKTQTFDVFGEFVDDHAEMDSFSTTDTDLDRQFRLAELKLGNEGVGIRYGTRYTDDDNPAGYKIDVIIFATDTDCMDMLHNYASSRFHDINDANRRRITGLSDTGKSMTVLFPMAISSVSITSGSQRPSASSAAMSARHMPTICLWTMQQEKPSST